ncbi:unnamed protein product [Soboliphyme baturini]|uniref:DUF5641 domain-containing protein n=1 Tax=Soboliphyme baturini TaxID=241478 RepID=A0A183IM46_9BILA|nr:unnamed protein product [Soboliphyme baturini]
MPVGRSVDVMVPDLPHESWRNARLVTGYDETSPSRLLSDEDTSDERRPPMLRSESSCANICYLHQRVVVCLVPVYRLLPNGSKPV